MLSDFIPTFILLISLWLSLNYLFYSRLWPSPWPGFSNILFSPLRRLISFSLFVRWFFPFGKDSFHWLFSSRLLGSFFLSDLQSEANRAYPHKGVLVQIVLLQFDQSQWLEYVRNVIKSTTLYMYIFEMLHTLDLKMSSPSLSSPKIQSAASSRDSNGPLCKNSLIRISVRTPRDLCLFVLIEIRFSVISSSM